MTDGDEGAEQNLQSLEALHLHQILSPDYNR